MEDFIFILMEHKDNANPPDSKDGEITETRTVNYDKTYLSYFDPWHSLLVLIKKR